MLMHWQVYAEGSLPAFASTWVGNYGWRNGMRAVPQGVNLNSPEVRRARNAV